MEKKETVTVLYYRENHPDHFVTIVGVFSHLNFKEIEDAIDSHMEFSRGVGFARREDYHTRTGVLNNLLSWEPSW